MRRPRTEVTIPMRVDYVLLVCDECGEATRVDFEQPLVGAVQLKRWFSDSATPCTCGSVHLQLKAHTIGKPDLA